MSRILAEVAESWHGLYLAEKAGNARLRADSAAALAKLRAEIAYLRGCVADLAEDDTRPGPEMRECAAAILDGTFRPAGST